jgi:hypothetical protein
MDKALTEALEPVWRDVRRTAGVDLRIADEPYQDLPRHPSAMVWDTDGTGAGFHTDLEASPRERVTQVADQVQEFVIEARSAAGLPSNWPPCPVHPDRHPLAPTASEPPSWSCPTTMTTVAPIGELVSATPG